VDAGCEYGYYASDITRTFPVNGRFSPPQRELYELVLEAQAAALNQVKPGSSWKNIHQAAVNSITKGLMNMNILRGQTNTLAQLISTKQYKQFYMHGTGHWLGLDVHDVGSYKFNKKWHILEPGNCLTIEPGIYIAPNARVHRRWRGIGIRIEDDVVVTDKGYEILSAAVPKTTIDRKGTSDIRSIIAILTTSIY
ncbi:Xaa-Pro aminopeptidase, partial [Achromatium sp. WMS1]